MMVVAWLRVSIQPATSKDHQLGRSVMAYPPRRATAHLLVTAPRLAMVDREYPQAFAVSGPYVAHPSGRHHLICRYLYRVQRCPDQFATWNDRQPMSALVRLARSEYGYVLRCG
jgi:hypothetical protein